DLVVMRVGAGAELDFLDLDDLLLLARLGLFLLLFVLELAEVHDLADRRHRVGRDLDEVEAKFLGHGHGPARRDHPDVLAVGAVEADRGGAGAFVDAWARIALRRRGVVRSAGYGGVPSVVAGASGGQTSRPAWLIQAGFGAAKREVPFLCRRILR